MRLSKVVIRYFSLTTPNASNSSLDISKFSSPELLNKQDLVYLKESYLNISIPKSKYKSRISTLKMEEELSNFINFVQEENPVKNTTKGRDYIIIDSPVTLSRSLPSIQDFYNKILKDFGTFWFETNKRLQVQSADWRKGALNLVVQHSWNGDDQLPSCGASKTRLPQIYG